MMLKIKRPTKFAVIVFLFVIYFVNIFNSGTAILMLLAFTFILLKGQSISLSGTGICVLLLYTINMILMLLNGVFTNSISIIYNISSIVLYFWGANIDTIAKSNNDRTYEQSIFGIILTCTLALFIYGILNWLARQIYQTGDFSGYSSLYQQMMHRSTYNFWNGASLASTSNAQYILPVLALFPVMVSDFTKQKRIIYLLCCFLGLACLMDIGVRSCLYIGMIVIAVYFFAHLWGKKIFNKQSLFRSIFIIVLIVGIIIVYRERISTYILNSTIVQRILYSNSGISGALDDNSRTEIYIYFLKNVFNYPFGGMPGYSTATTSMHNQFFTLYQIGGVIPFILYIVIWVSFIARTIRIYLRHIPLLSRCFVYFCLAFSLLYMIEGTFLSNTIVHSFIMFMMGIAENINHDHNLHKKEV